MKKSTIIVPALAVIAMSTAASITGTVAWFTASRSATVTASDFAIAKTSANMQVALSEGIGTSVTDSGDTHTVTMNAANYKLGHASFDHSTSKVYIPTVDGKSIDRSVTLSDSTTADNVKQSTEGSIKIISCASWKITFTMTFGNSGRNTALYLDTKSANTFVKNSSTNAAPTKTGKAFRVAFVPDGTPTNATGVTRVWAPNQGTEDEVQNCKYVNATTAEGYAGVAYTGHTLLCKDYDAAVPADEAINASTAQNREDYLGTFTFSSGATATVTYRVVCWYEGTDPEINDSAIGSDLETVKASFQFEARTLA